MIQCDQFKAIREPEPVRQRITCGSLLLWRSYQGTFIPMGGPYDIEKGSPYYRELVDPASEPPLQEPFCVQFG